MRFHCDDENGTRTVALHRSVQRLMAASAGVSCSACAAACGGASAASWTDAQSDDVEVVDPDRPKRDHVALGGTLGAVAMTVACT